MGSAAVSVKRDGAGLTAAEHLEAALRMLGLEHGSWKLELEVADGRVRRIVGDPRGVKVAFDRDQLDAFQPPTEMGESAA